MYVHTQGETIFSSSCTSVFPVLELTSFVSKGKDLRTNKDLRAHSQREGHCASPVSSSE